MRNSRLKRRYLRWLGFSAAAPLVLFTIVLAAIQTSPGKKMLASIGGRLSSGGGLTVAISEIGGLIPTDMRVGAVTLSDPRGEFARIEDIRLVWHVSALFRGTLAIETLQATRVVVARKPELPPASETAHGSAGGTSIPVRVVLDRLAVDEIDLAEAVAGQAAKLAFMARARLVEPARGLSLAFAIERRDADGIVKGSLGFAPDTKTLAIDMQAREPEGGLAARLAGIEGLPAVRAEINGNGPLDSWNGTLNVAAGPAIGISAVAGIRRQENRYRLTVGMDANVQRLLPASLASLFEGVSKVAASALIDDGMRRLEIETLTARTTGFGAAITGSVDRSTGTADLAFDVTSGDAAHFATLLRGPAWSSAHLKGTLRGELAAPAIDATLAAEEFSAAGYGARVLGVRAGTVPDSTGDLRWTIDGNVAGLRGPDLATTGALGEKGTFSLSGEFPAGNTPALTHAEVDLKPLDLRFEGRVQTNVIEGALRLKRLDLGVLSSLTGRPLHGELMLDADLGPGRTPGTMRAQINGASRDVATGNAAVDGLLGGAATLVGAIACGTDGSVAADGLKLDAAGLHLQINGQIDRSTADLSARALVSDLARIDRRVDGRAEAELAFTGSLHALAAKARFAVPHGHAMEQPVADLTLLVDARDITGRAAADARLGGRIGDKTATGTASLFTAADGTRTLRGLSLSIGSVMARGDLSVSAAGLLDGRIEAAARNLADLSALALTELAGTAQATLAFAIRNEKQQVGIDAAADQVRAAGTALDSARINFSIADPAGALSPSGTADISGFRTDGLHVDKMTLVASPAGDDEADMKLDMRAQGVVLAATARLASRANARVLRLDTFRAARDSTRLSLSAPATITFADGALAIDRLAVASGNGSAVVRGKAGETIDLDVDLRNLPLALAGFASPRFDVSGTLSGAARLSGPAATPNGNYDLTVSRISTPDLARSGVGPLDVKARGVLASGRVGVDVRASGPSLSGAAVTGWIPLGAGAMEVNIKGSVALGIANAMLATYGSRATGTATIDMQLNGTLANPQPGGSVRISGARFDDAVNGLSLDGIEGTITATGRSVTTSLGARTRNGGSVAVKGDIGIDPARGFPGNLEITLQNAGLVSSELMRLATDGKIAITGALARRPRLIGRFDVKSLDINIPDKLPGGADMLEVRHTNTAPGQNGAKGALAKRQLAKSGGKAADAAIVADLDLAINATNNVFVRGMGMESELGGNLTLKGTSVTPTSVGNFEMRRGRFDILGRRLDFSRGKVTFNGTIDPNLDFIAETKSDDVTTKVVVSGLASQPQITFASSPELPQDEILARLLFNKSAGSLTAGQAVQIAQTIAQFSGGGASVTENVRRSLGVDSLDVGADKSGGQVGLAKRLNERIYLGVRQGTSPGSSKATIDIDITKNIRVQGATGADGGTETGVGVHWDY